MYLALLWLTFGKLYSLSTYISPTVSDNPLISTVFGS